MPNASNSLPVATSTPVGPRDAKGRLVSRECPRCGNGTLQFEGLGVWRCDGLSDPESSEKPLEACTYSHEDGTAPVSA